MNTEQLLGIVRAILTAAGGYIVAKGVVDNATMLAVVGGVVTIFGALWSWYSNKSGKVIQ